MTLQRQSDRAFGITFACFLAVVFAIGWLVSGTYHWWLIICVGLAVIAALIYPSALLPLNRLWVRLIGGLGWINNRILLAVIFFGLITPIGFILRMFGKDLLNHKIDPQAETYLTPLVRHSDAASFRDQF